MDGDGVADWFEGLMGSDNNDPNSRPNYYDVNNDGVIQNLDALLLTRVVNLTIDGTGMQLPDVDLDGDIDQTDATLLYQWTVGQIPLIPTTHPEFPSGTHSLRLSVSTALRE
jgi:hypothetical protein